MSIYLLGPPGSGKGTYGKLLSSSLSLPLLTASTMLKSDPTFVTNYISKGKLGPDDVVESSVRSYLFDGGWGTEKLTEKGWFSKRFILDGFPRTLGQYKLMSSWSPLLRPPSLCVHVDLPLDICVEKIKGRVECKYCKSVWNLADVESEGGYVLPGIWPHFKKCFCEECTKLTREVWDGKYDREWMVRRDDDVVDEVVEGRMEEYRNCTEGILEEVEEGRKVVFKPWRGLDSFGELEVMVKEKLVEIEEEEDFIL
ncbi:hypothetical protein TrST_g650 [Triparma strigata]|uniref:Adenylate kinase n=1 Tax=Triparma strigata TaxID=1606541 RepID=A0A9W7AM90_9STRA|nr:hypothetical protein TrST_g650 [Triparma strigata]